MAQKKFKQFFARDFIGIDGESSAIEDDPNGVNRAVNLEMGVSNALRGRVGCQIAGQVAGPSDGNDYGMFAIFPYKYIRTQDQYDIVYDAGGTLSTTKTTADGATIEKLIGINSQAWVLDTMNIPVTRVSGTYPFTWYSYVNGSAINFCIKANGVSILDTSMGDGIFSSVTSIYSLLGTIDALAELSVSRGTRGVCPPFAIANGAQSSVLIGDRGYGYQQRITVVDTPHTFRPGDIITFRDASGLTFTGGRAGGIVYSTTATTIDYVGLAGALSDQQVIGYMGQPASVFPITTAESAASGNLTLSFPYWRLIPDGDRFFCSIYSQAQTQWVNRFDNPTLYGRFDGSFYSPPTAVNAAGNLYLAMSSPPGTVSTGAANKLTKIDGLTVGNAGIGTPSIVVASPGAGALTGAYKYKAFYRRIDGQGNIVEGRPTDVTSITLAAQYAQITATVDLYTDASGYQRRSAYKNTAESPAAGAAFLVDGGGNTAFLQPGDPICLLDGTTAQKTGLWHQAFGVDMLGTLHRTVCTYYDGIGGATSQIKVADSSGYLIPDNTEISTGSTVVFLRNTAGGNLFYVLAEMPYTGFGPISFFDNVTDTVLSASEQFIDAEIGKEHDPPPNCSLVCEHQGGLVVARGFNAPNTVSFSSLDGLEYFPLATNSFDVPSTQSGAVTAIASDTNDRLAVFKDRAYYDVTGDLDGGAFSVNVKHEGDYGIASQASLVRVRGILIGLSRNGFVMINDGVLAASPYRRLNSRLINQSSYQFGWATAVNDPLNMCYICSIPTDDEPVTYVLSYSKDGVVSFERSYPTRIDPAGGMAIVGDEMYHLSQTYPFGVFRSLQRFNGDSPSGNGDGDSFIDNTSAIEYILESSVLNNGEPDILNTPIRARVWSIPNDYVVDGWVPFSALLEGGCSPLAANCGTGNNSTSSTITFATSSDLYKDVKLVSTKTHFYIIRLTTNAIRTAPFITGYEILYAESYNPEDLIK